MAEGEIEEQKKNDLSTKKNFNCEDAFRLFIDNNQSQISPRELKEGLRLLGLNCTDYEIQLLFKRFDFNNNGFIDFPEFFDMLVPFEKAYRDMVQKRKTNSCCPCKSPEIFAPDTIESLKNVFKLIISHEIKINELRQKLHLYASSSSDISQFIGYMKDNNHIEDLIIYCRHIGIFTNEREANLLFIRLDRKRCGIFDIHSLDEEMKVL